MAKYYKLDEVGFVGTQGKRSDAEIKRDIEITIEFIKKKKAAQTNDSSNHTRITLSGGR